MMPWVGRAIAATGANANASAGDRGTPTVTVIRRPAARRTRAASMITARRVDADRLPGSIRASSESGHHRPGLGTKIEQTVTRPDRRELERPVDRSALEKHLKVIQTGGAIPAGHGEAARLRAARRSASLTTRSSESATARSHIGTA